MPFLGKWGWLVKGCKGLIESTDFWRERKIMLRWSDGGGREGRLVEDVAVKEGAMFRDDARI